ncbi:hypothetical protein ACHAXT_002886 [Thalassiosira profunda]
MKTTAALASALVVLAASPADAQMAIPRRLRAHESKEWGRKTTQPMKQRKLEKASGHAVEDEVPRILQDMSMSVAFTIDCAQWDGYDNKKKCPKDSDGACEFDKGTESCVPALGSEEQQIDFLSTGRETMESAGVIGINTAQSFAAPVATLNALAFVCAVANYLF